MISDEGRGVREEGGDEKCWRRGEGILRNRDNANFYYI